MNLIQWIELLISGENDSLVDGRYPMSSPKNLHGRIKSIEGNTVEYDGSAGDVSSDIMIDEGPAVVVNDKRDGWLRLWKDVSE